MRCDSNKTRDDEFNDSPADDSWLEEYDTPQQRLRRQAERSLDQDPLPGYGLSADIPDIGETDDSAPSHSYGYYRSTYTKLKRQK